MITQIEIDGFKTFKDFKVELAPFQVIVGPNGSGKSNLFDALQLVSQFMIPGNDVYKAMQGIRGEAGELFTKYPDGSTSDTIRIAVEVLVDQKAAFSDGREIDLKFARFRYELEIRVDKQKDTSYQRYHDKQQLKIIPNESDNWCKKYNILPLNNLLQNISINSSLAPTFLWEQMNDIQGKKSIQEMIDRFNVTREKYENFSRSFNEVSKKEFSELNREFNELNDAIKASKDSSELHSICLGVIQEELRSLSFYRLNPEALRKRSSTSAPPYLASDGSNLPAMLARIKAEDPVAFQLISHNITSLVSDVLRVDVEKYDAIGEYGIHITTFDKRTFTAQALSDGTLRLLALATLRNDPQFHGTICIEEPENGVQPLYLHKFARLLHDIATDFADRDDNEPLRQVIVITHSPIFISQPAVIDHLLLATMPTRVSPQTQSSLKVTRMEPVITPATLAQANLDPAEDRASRYYTINIVRKYLDGDTLQQANEQLEQARSDLHKI